MTDLTRLTIAEARSRLKAREFSAREITDAYLSAIDAANPHFNAYVAVTHDKARDMAAASEGRLTLAEGDTGLSQQDEDRGQSAGEAPSHTVPPGRATWAKPTIGLHPVPGLSPNPVWRLPPSRAVWAR